MIRLKNEGVRVQTCVTSPPYWGLRDYGHAGQIGLEESPEAYTAAMVEVFRLVRELLQDDGTLWLNLGDSYATQPGKGNNVPQTKWNAYPESAAHRHNDCGLAPKNLVGIPWRVAFALQADGWYLRSDIIWHKMNPMPESVTDRPTKAHEYIFLLSKREKYYYDHEAIKEPVAESTIGRGPIEFGGAKGRNYKPEKGDPNYRGGNEQWGRTFDYTESCKGGRNKRTVWNVASIPYPGSHFAVFPPELITPCILAGARVGDVVFDPFGGSGTTGQVAESLGRRWILCELNEQYKPLWEERTAQCGLSL